MDRTSSQQKFLKSLILGFAIALAVWTPRSTQAAGLSEQDYIFVEKEFGFARNSFTLMNMSAEDAAQLAAVINDPVFSSQPSSRFYNVQTALFAVERRTCEAWDLAHDTRCPEVVDKRLKPGWAVAEHRCIACHLTGTTSAPSFFKMAQIRVINETFLSNALLGDHAMSPIVLSQPELRDLATYINSLR